MGLPDFGLLTVVAGIYLADEAERRVRQDPSPPPTGSDGSRRVGGAGPAQLANLKRVLRVMLVYVSSRLPVPMAEGER